MKTYDANEIIITVAGFLIDAGRDSGEFLSFSTDNPEYSKTVGADGEPVLNRNNDRSITATLTLMQSSLSNDKLSSLVVLDRQSPGGITYPFVVRHIGTTTLVVSGAAKITSTPRSSAAWGAELGTSQWVFELTKVSEFFGGMPENELAPI